MGTCLNCNQPTETFANGNSKKYCSTECNKQYYKLNRKEKIICEICSTKFEAPNNSKPKFCSDECRIISRETSHRKIWDGDKKICLDCGIAKEISEYQKEGKDEKGEQRYNPRCKECIKPLKTSQYRRENQGTIQFTCKQCGTPSTHYDRRYTTFCSRECSFAYRQGKEKYEPLTCKRCDKPLSRRTKGEYTYCISCRPVIDKERAEEKAIKEKLLQDQLEEEKRNRAIRTLAKRKEQLEKRLAKEKAQEKARDKALNKNCNICKKPFRAKSVQAKLCPKCRFGREMIKEISRGKRSKSILPINFERFDEDITLEKLFKRDKGICHICNITCNYNDYRHNENNAFIAGATYPSQDHVIALANGGTHTWDNVKLAHKRCNELKNAYDINDSDNQLEFFL